MFFLQERTRTVYDKFEGLNKIGEKSSDTPILVFVLIALTLLAGGVYWYFRRRQTEDQTEGRAVPQPGSWASLDDKTAVSLAKDARPLDQLSQGADVVLVWTRGSHRISLSGNIRTSLNADPVVETQLNAEGPFINARLFVPETDGAVLVYPVTINSDGSTRVQVHQVLGGKIVRIGHGVRVTANFRAAALPLGSGNGKGLAIRVTDVSAHGLGLIAEEPLESGTRFVVRASLPGQNDPLTSRFEVKWADTKSPVACRAGLELEPDDVIGRARLSDFLLQNSTHRV